MFQQMVELENPINSEEHDILSYNNALRNTCNEFLLTDNHMESQYHFVGVSLNQMSSKTGMNKHGAQAKEFFFT